MGKYDALFVDEAPAAAAVPQGKYAVLFAEEQAAPQPDVTLAQAMFPRATRDGANLAQRIGGAALDVSSLPGRLAGSAQVPPATMQMGWNPLTSPPSAEPSHAEVQQQLKNVADTQGKNIGQRIIRDPALIPSLLSGAGAAGLAERIGLKGLGLVFGTGGLLGAESAGIHQTDNAVQGKDVNLKDAALETVLSAALPTALSGAMQGAKRIAVPWIKQLVSRFSEVPSEALDEVSAPGTGAPRLAQIQDAARKFSTEEGSTNLMPMSEDLAQRVSAENTGRIAATDAARAAQANQMENNLVIVRNSLSGSKANRIGDISADAQGSQIKAELKAAKGPLQDRFVEGDTKAYGVLKDAKVAPGLPQKIDEVLGKWKALDPKQGVPGINPSGQRAINSIRDLSEQANTVDDLVNLKRRIRTIQADGGFEGAPFDASTDDKALSEVMGAVQQHEAHTITQAAGAKRAAQILPMIQDNNRLYGESLQTLRDGAKRFIATQNSEGIISKVKSLGPEKARDLMSQMQSNQVLAPYVKELQNGFVDDLLLSSVKNGEFEPAQFAKSWSNMSDDLKKAWLDPAVVARIDKVTAEGTQEIADPEMVGKGLFGAGDKPDVFNAEHKLANIGTAAQRKALAELKTLDGLFGSDYTKEATAAFRAKQLQLNPEGQVPKMGNIRTGKALGGAGIGASTGAAIGASVAGPVGAGVGSAVGSGVGFYLQSPAGALLMYKALNRLPLDFVSSIATNPTLGQGLRSAAFGPQENNP